MSTFLMLNAASYLPSSFEKKTDVISGYLDNKFELENL